MSLPQPELSPYVDGPSPSDVRDPFCAHMMQYGYYSDSITFAQIQSSAASCRICHLYMDIILAVVTGFLPSVFQGPRNEAEEELILECLVLSRTLKGPNHLCFNVLEINVDIEFFRDGDVDGGRDFTIQGEQIYESFRIGPQTISEASFAKARRWLHECVTSHRCLELSLTSIQLPKRLVDVRGSAKDPVRLIETRGDEYPYACLSHRWGSPEHKRLISTTRTIRDHMSKITWDDLPATFRDAVTICRSMEVSYCWIDSLCILQNEDCLTDDEVEATRLDFARENSVMAKTYYNSHFTISADLSTHMDSGIFSKQRIDDHRIEVTDDDGDSAAIYFRRFIHHFEHEIPDLETRGWTFQEFALPRRMLHFGAFDIEWRCINRHTCECGQLDTRRNKKFLWHHHHDLAKVATPVPHGLKGALRWWQTVVGHYTNRKLTNASDKLPALSGLAQLRKEARGGIYLAGLWQDSLIHDLCWFHTLGSIQITSGGTGRRPVDYRAPSWSWASLDTSLRCKFWWSGIAIHPAFSWAEPRQACTIFESICRPKTADTTGEVQFGFLDIGVVLIPATICLDPGQKVAWTITNIETDLELSFFNPDCELENDGLSDEGQVYCAPIAEAATGTGLQRCCLVLKKLYTSLYQRVGFCVLKKGESEHLANLQEYPPRLNHQDYSLRDADKLRIIII